MKNVIVSNYDDLENSFYGGGGAIAINEVFKRLTKKYSVTVITGKYPGCKASEEIDGIKYIRVGSKTNNSKLSQIIYQLLLLYFAMTLKYDLWIESFTPPFSVSILPLIINKPLIGLVHMLSGEDMQRKYLFPFQIIEKLGLRMYKYIISPSEINSNKIIKNVPGIKLITVPNGVNNPVCTKIKKIKKEFITYIGRIEVNQKGLDLLIKSYKYISNKTSVKLLIAGSGEKKEIEKLQRLISNNHLNNKIKLLGKISGCKKSEFFAKSILMTIPSRFETFSIVALETLVSGTPLITFDIKGLSWITNNSSLKIESFDFRKYGEGIIELLNNNKLRKKLSKFSQRESKKYTWNNSSVMYELFIDKILKGEI
jgi:phosphatidyl-myo-inositol alpha-mannosyltransferase